jgi:hypothetical protein
VAHGQPGRLQSDDREQLPWAGVTTVQRWELQAWYGVQRINKNVWRDLKTQYDEAFEGTAELSTVFNSLESALVGLFAIHTHSGKSDWSLAVVGASSAIQYRARRKCFKAPVHALPGRQGPLR